MFNGICEDDFKHIKRRSVMRGQAYRIPKHIRCEVCEKTLSSDNTFFYIVDNQPYAFCDPPKRSCFNDWYKIQMSPEMLRPKGLL